MFSNSPENIQTISAEKRLQILEEVVRNIISSSPKNSLPLSFSESSKFIQSKRDHPFVSQPELHFGEEQKLADGTRLSFSYKLFKHSTQADFVISLDSSKVEGLAFEAQKGKFIFYLSKNDNRFNINFVGIQDPSQQFTSTAQPVLDATLEKRLIQLLDNSISTLLEQQRNTQHLQITSLMQSLINNNSKFPSDSKLILKPQIHLNEINLKKNKPQN